MYSETHRKGRSLTRFCKARHRCFELRVEDSLWWLGCCFRHSPGGAAPSFGRSAWVFRGVASTTCIPCAFVGFQPKHDLPLWFSKMFWDRNSLEILEILELIARVSCQQGTTGAVDLRWSSEFLFSFWGLTRGGLDLVYRHVTRIKLRWRA